MGSQSRHVRVHPQQSSGRSKLILLKVRPVVHNLDKDKKVRKVCRSKAKLTFSSSQGERSLIGLAQIICMFMID